MLRLQRLFVEVPPIGAVAAAKGAPEVAPRPQPPAEYGVDIDPGEAGWI